MPRPFRNISALVLAIGSVLALSSPAPSQINSTELPAEYQGVVVNPELGSKLPLDLRFTNAQGEDVSLGDYFDGERPVIIVPAYYDCPMLCIMMLDRVADALNTTDYRLAEDFRVVTFSFDHRNTPSDALAKQRFHLSAYRKAEFENPDDAWAFLVSDAFTAQRLCAALGYSYNYIPERREFAHNAALYFITPDGQIHNFIESLEFSGPQFTVALQEAVAGEIGTVWQRFAFTCFQMNPATGEYIIRPQTVMAIIATFCAMLLFTVLAVLFFNDVRRRRRLVDALRQPRVTDSRSSR